jgi:hypothetical protein
MMEVIVKKFDPHYNLALDKVVTSERQYKEEMRKGGFISQERGDEIVRNNIEKRKEFKISKNAETWMREARMTADRQGNVKLSDRQVDAMRQMGMKFQDPKLNAVKGGFR